MANRFKNHDSPAKSLAATEDSNSFYDLAHRDVAFLEREELRSLRFQIEMLKPELMLDDANIESTLVIYGSARTTQNGTNAHNNYEEARALARLASSLPVNTDGSRDFVVCSGGGPSIMEAANRGAADVGKNSIGLNIVLPREQVPNDFVTPELTFQFHYFPLRKMHFILRAKAIAVFPGGFGTLDEFFDVLTLMQTGKMPMIPLLLFDREFWEATINFQTLVSAGTIDARDVDLFQFVDSAEEAWAAVQHFYIDHPQPVWHKKQISSDNRQ